MALGTAFDMHLGRRSSLIHSKFASALRSDLLLLTCFGCPQFYTRCFSFFFDFSYSNNNKHISLASVAAVLVAAAFRIGTTASNATSINGTIQQKQHSSTRSHNLSLDCSSLLSVSSLAHVDHFSWAHQHNKTPSTAHVQQFFFQWLQSTPIFSTMLRSRSRVHPLTMNTTAAQKKHTADVARKFVECSLPQFFSLSIQSDFHRFYARCLSRFSIPKWLQSITCSDGFTSNRKKTPIFVAELCLFFKKNLPKFSSQIIVWMPQIRFIPLLSCRNGRFS